MVDEKGSPVWFKKVPDPANVAIDFKTQQYRNKPVLTWWEGTIGGTGGQGVGPGRVRDRRLVVPGDHPGPRGRIRAGRTSTTS
jgi:hypothetical protein